MHDQHSDSPSTTIRVRGARVHNLQNVDVDIPRDRLVVITGVSGSGKSSLAFDAIHAEGQRRFLETLSAQARRYLDQMPRPDVDEIDGLPATLAISQRAGPPQPRSTLATLTEIHDFLRLLYARAGTAHCPQCGRVVSQQSAQAIVEGILALEAGRKVMILAPLVHGRKGTHRKLFEKIVRDGFVRARIDGEIVDAAAPPALKKSRPHDIEVVIDRIIVKDGLRARLQDSVELALRHGGGKCVVSYEAGAPLQGDAGANPKADNAARAIPARRAGEGVSDHTERAPSLARRAGAWHDRLFSSRYSCPDCELSFPDIEPRTFSYNSPYGACPTCEGTGVIPSPPLQGGAKGSRAARRSSSDGIHLRVEGQATPATCPDCRGARLAAVGRAVTFRGVAIHELCALTVAEAERRVEEWCDAEGRQRPATTDGEGGSIGTELAPAGDLVAARVLPEIAKRLKFLRKVGLDYLTLDRPATTLSGGESQRARLAGCLGSGLLGVCFILDEPTIGLHPRDTRRLLDALVELRDQGNSVLVVEHDTDVIRAADVVVDLGPGAGRDGGHVIAQGTPAELKANEQSITGRYLRTGMGNVSRSPTTASGGRQPPEAAENAEAVVRTEQVPSPHDDIRGTRELALVLTDASARNLKQVTAAFPFGKLTCVTGVSGSGKSTLVLETLVPLVREALARRAVSQSVRSEITEGARLARSKSSCYAAAAAEAEISAAQLAGVEHVDRLIEVDQSPLGRNARSNPATVSTMWDEFRKLFARTREARLRGFRAARFSFNASDGRCGACHGLGTRRVSMHFLPDIEVVCPICHGARFNRQTLEIKYRGKSPAEVLAMRVDEAAEFFANVPALAPTLRTFLDVGLGYLTLGQPATTLSGGEAQRIRLATELSRPGSGRTLYVLDEPTTGLHQADIERLLRLLLGLTEQGHSVIVIEHQLDLIVAADWIVDLGPEGGAEGGRVVVAGTPHGVAKAPESHTGRALLQRLHQTADARG